MRHTLLALVFALIASAASAQGWDSLYKARLEASAAYLEARLALRSAEVALDNYTKPYLPRVSVATSSSLPLTISGAGFSGTVVPSINLENILGADISLKAPLKASSSGGIGLGDPSISLSRKIFVETAADRLDAEAALMAAKSALKKAADGVRVALATEILNAVYYRNLLEVNRANLLVLERVRKAQTNSSSSRELERRVLGAKKSALIASNALAALDEEIRSGADLFYRDLLLSQEEWTASMEEDEPRGSTAIRALELSLEAAERRKAFALLPWLPNPGLTASLSYDMAEGQVEWGLSLSLSYDVFDKGARSLSLLRREEYPKIIGLKLEAARKDLSYGIRRIKGSLETLELDRQLQELDIADAQDDVSLLERLWNGGYASEEDFVITQIDLSVEKLEAQRIAHDLLIQTLNLAGYREAGLEKGSGPRGGHRPCPGASEGRKYLRRVSGRSHLREDLHHDAAAVDDKGRTDHPHDFLPVHHLLPESPVLGQGLPLRIGEEDEGQGMLFQEFGVRGRRIGADAYDADSPFRELADGVAELARFHGAARGVIPGIEIEHETASGKILKGPGFSRRIGQGKIGRLHAF